MSRFSKPLLTLRRSTLLGVFALAVTVAIIGALASAPEPASGNPLPDVVAIDGGLFHTCALTSGGGAKCWGHNGQG